jgi:TolB-like protein/Flp pilus assembly protein TadD
MRPLQDLFAELRRRRVFRALLGWGLASFGVLQVYEPVMHGLHLPEWTLTFVVVLLGLGFPVTAVLAWAYDLTASGIERTPPLEPEGAAPSTPRRRRVALLVGIGVAAALPGLAWLAGWPAARRPAAETPRPASELPSIAVLPFVNLSSDKEQEYFSDGIAEEILNALAQVEGLKVIGRTSSFAMRGQAEDLRAVGLRLGAANILEGSVRRGGGRVRVTAQLIEAVGGSHRWSQAFDREAGDVLAVQEEIARAVVAALELKLLPGARDEQPAPGPEAHDLYLRSLALVERGSLASYRAACEALRRAVKLEPRYAQAWALLSSAHYMAADQGSTGTEGSNAELPAILHEAEQAVALAPHLADAFVARGQLRQFVLLDWNGARADLQRARALNPGSVRTMAAHAMLLLALGRNEEALAALEQAASLDPLSVEVQYRLGIANLAARRYSGAEAAAGRALALSPEHGRAARTLGFALLLQGRWSEAQAAFHRSTNQLFIRMGESMVEHSRGNVVAARKALDPVLQAPDPSPASYQLAEVFAWRGEREEAFRWLKRAVEVRDPGLNYLRWDPFLDPLRGDARFKEILRAVHLADD